jgi:hypothetical protein
LPFPAALTIEGKSCMFVILSDVWIYNQVKLVLLFILIIITCFMKRKFKQWWSAITQITTKRTSLQDCLTKTDDGIWTGTTSCPG